MPVAIALGCSIIDLELVLLWLRHGYASLATRWGVSEILEPKESCYSCNI
ncbi:unnamed protein product [Acidithrix sp. C25]|nr:unnamed protein product [Acidithrix sp. C25]